MQSSANSLTRRNVAALSPFEELGYFTTDNNLKAVRKADFIVLAVLPQQLNKLLDEIGPSLNPEKQLLISVVSGLAARILRNNLP